MTLEERKKLFLERATGLHGNKFDYSKINFINQKEKITIICREHGKFQQSPDKHIAKNAKGCPRCWEQNKKEVLKVSYHVRKENGEVKTKDVLSEQSFISRARKKYGEKFNYDLKNYTGFTGNKITITCKIHGSFTQTPQSHMQTATGCKQCGRERAKLTTTKSYHNTIEQFKIKHQNYYDYPEYNEKIYRNKRSKIDIFCKKHGKFTKSAQKHLSGQGCWPCRVDEMIAANILVGGYTEDLFKEKPELKNLPANIYYLEVNNGEYYKIGISRINLNSRIASIICKARSFDANIKIKLLYSKEKKLYECFRLEQKILNDYKDSLIYTKWSTELFNKDIFAEISNYFI